MRARLAILLAVAACAAGAEDFTLDGGIVATTAPDGGVTFRAGDATLSFAPFECAPSESGEKPVLTFRADGDALVAEVAGDPAAFGRVSFGRCSAMPKELYFGYGYCVRDPGRLHVPLNGHHNATRFAGFTFANGLSLVLATTTAPDALFVDPEKGAFGFACSQPTRFTFVPGRAGAFDCALRARRHFPEKAPRGFAAKAGRFCVDTWNGAFAQHERLIRRCAEYGLRDDLLFYVHCWQRYGFDRHLPDVYPPSPTFGTAAELKRACATAHAHGWSFGVHLNVIDCYTNSPWFDWSKISHDAKGRPIKAWINPPYQERSYRLLPEFAPASISYQVESLLADGFCPDTVFVDVTGSGAMSSGTCRDSAGRVHPLISNTAANGRMFDTARALLEGAGKRPTFVSSEAPCDYLAGHMDGGDCQWMFLSHEKDVYRWMTVGGTGLVTKVPWMPLVWHDRLSLHGAGYSARFEGARGEDCHGIDSDDYISCEIMNGHSLMADCYNRDAYKAEAGILDAIDEPRCLRQIVRKYWLAQHVIREIGAASMQSVSFPDGDPRHVKVVWSTGMTVMVNRDVRDWMVTTGDTRVGEVILPQYGFVAFNPKTGNYASIRRTRRSRGDRPTGGRVVEESAYRDGAKLVRYVNPRGADTACNRLPLVPATAMSGSGDHFSATVNWQPFGGKSVPKGTFRVSLWLLDPMFREYSPKDAALRVATADVTLDQPTRFSFAWPKGMKGPRVVHVAVAPAGADADNPDLRFKLLGTSAFYRRYRQGALTAQGTWTPYRCPDENLWERLFPPTEPVDYGWITTDEAFRLITEPGKPDVKIPLPAGLAVFGKVMKVAGGPAGAGHCVNVADGLLYVGGKGTLGVYDLSGDPLRPKLLGEADGLATARQVALQGGMAYVTARANGIWVVDCRNPAKPFVAGHYPSTANCTGIDVAGDVCFVGGSKSGLEFIDVSRPQSPQLIRCEKMEPVESQSVAYRDGLLFSGEWGGKCVTIWDVRDMKSPKRLACCPLASNGDGVWVDGRWLYASTGFSKEDKKPGAQAHPGQMGLEIYDVADPRAPKKVSRVDFEYCKPCTYDMWLVRVSDGMAFCAATAGGLYAVDVSDKSAPKVVDRWVPEKRRQVTSVAVGNGVVYVTVAGSGTWAIEAKGAKRIVAEKGKPPANAHVRPLRPEKPKGFHRWLPSDKSLTANVTGLAVKGNVCYAAAGTAGLFVLELAETGIKEIKRIPLAECMDAAIAGERLFVAAGREGWIVYEMEPSGGLKEIARMPSAVARDVYAYGDGTRWAAFNTTVYDISDLAKPKPLACLVNQSRYNKFLSPDLIGGRWVAGNSALKYFSWLDVVASKGRVRKMEGYQSRMGGMCAFGEKAFLADNGGWAIVEPGGQDVPRMRPFPGKKRAMGLPRWNGGKLVALSGSDRTASIWDFGDVENPRLVRWLVLPCPVDAAGFWRDTLVIPARLQGVLVPENVVYCLP